VTTVAFEASKLKKWLDIIGFVFYSLWGKVKCIKHMVSKGISVLKLRVRAELAKNKLRQNKVKKISAWFQKDGTGGN